MRKRLASLLVGAGVDGEVPRPSPPPILTAIRRTFQAGYDRKALTADVLAGLVVGIVAIPLSMALAIAVDAPPQNGLYTAVVAGAVVAVLGGSKFQITGPTAAFVVILAPIVAKHGLGGLLTAGLLAGMILVAMGWMRLGRLLQFIPHPVTTGFTAGIATVIATLQLRDFLGLQVADAKAFSRMDYVEKVEALWHARGTIAPSELAVGAVTLGLLLVVPKITRKVPAPLLVLTFVSVVVLGLGKAWPGLHVATIGDRYHPPVPPHPMVPWGDARLSLAYVRELLPSASAIAMLGAIESLLSAVIADGMTGKRHDPNAELVALGVGNIVAPFFGGIAATGALARTATNIRAGARSPLAGVVHAAVVLLFMLFLAPAVSYVPMTSLAALLLLVAWNMSEVRHAIRIVRIAPKSDVAVLLTCFVLTVVFDMVVAVSVGVMLAALLFMRRMSELTQSRIYLGSEEETQGAVPKGVVVYEIAGPMFFGAAQNAMGSLSAIGEDTKVVVLDLGRCPTIDATGLVALESSLLQLRAGRKRVIVAGPLPQPRRVFDKADLLKDVRVAESRERAIEIASEVVDMPLSERTPPVVPHH